MVYRVEGHGDATVLDVVCQNKRIEIEKNVSTDKIKQLQEEIKELEKIDTTLRSRSERYLKGLVFVTKNK